MIRQQASDWLSSHLVTPLHGSFISKTRLEKLSQSFLKLLPQAASKGLDVGCGSGELAMIIQKKRPDIELTGVDVILREDAAIQVHQFDGKTLPFSSKSFDFVIISDVLHHTNDPDSLLKECARVARSYILIKDHICDSLWDRTLLTFMDWVGNRGHGVALPYNYLSTTKWYSTYRNTGLTLDKSISHLGLYPQPFSIIFDRTLHFACRLTISPT